MSVNSGHVRAPLRPGDPQSSPPFLQKQDQKRNRSQTLGTTFVSTAIVPASSSTDVLSSLIGSLTLLSDSAREQIRSAREIQPVPSNYYPEPAFTDFAFPFDSNNELNKSVECNVDVIDIAEGEEAEPPAIGYSRTRQKDQKSLSHREKWTMYGPSKDKIMNLGRSVSSQATQRPSSGSSGVGMPSIERGHPGSLGSLPIAIDTKSPSNMIYPPTPEDESNQSMFSTSRDFDTRSVKSFRTVRSKLSAKMSREHETESRASNYEQPAREGLSPPLSPPLPVEKFTPEHKHYSPLSPANREDLSEHLIPSRRSSMRHSPGMRGTSKGRSPSMGRSATTPSKSFSTVNLEFTSLDVSEAPFDEEDSTLRRIRELQQAKEKRHSEWRKESKRSERLVRKSLRNLSKSGDEDVLGANTSFEARSIANMPSKYQKSPDRSAVEYRSAPVSREVDVPSPGPSTPAMPSPVWSTPRKHKRSLSAGLRRSNSSKQRPVDDLRTVSEQVEAFLTAPRLTQRIRHPRTGRTIAFSEVGDPEGFAVFCCVGMGLTRYVTSFYDDIARTQKLRLITPDRPGIGESSPFPDNVCTPLAWVDDVAVICQALNIDKFSLLAHSAGSIYALAAALKMPDMVRGRIHLLAPWIPPSQFPSGSSNSEIRAANFPITHRILSFLPAPFLKAANSRFLSSASASIEPKTNQRKNKDHSISATYDALLAEMAADMQPSNLALPNSSSARTSSLSHYANTPTSTPPPYNYPNGTASVPGSPSPTNMKRQFSSSTRLYRSPTPNESPMGLTTQAKAALFNTELTHRTWTLATLNANPAVDLLVCLERRRRIGFKYTDVTRGVVIHHGRNDARVPLANVQWLSQVMKRCELRVLSDEGHGLMASADVMSRVLGEIGREWEEWDAVARENEKKQRQEETEKEMIKDMERKRYIREGR